MNGWELNDPQALLARADTDAIRDFSRSYQLAATNPEATALVLIRKYALEEDCEPGKAKSAPSRGGFRVGLCVFTAESKDVFQLPTLRTYLSLSLVGTPADATDKIVIETDLGEALTNVTALVKHLPLMSAGELKEPVLESAYTEIE
jgi:hypothetical protein